MSAQLTNFKKGRFHANCTHGMRKILDRCLERGPNDVVTDSIIGIE